MGGLIVVLFLIITGQVRVCDWLFGPAPISREQSSISAGSSLRYEILTCNLRLLAVYVSLLAPKGQANIGVL